MWGEQLAKAMASFPALVWALLAAYVIWLLREALPLAIRSLSNVEAFGLKLTLSGSQAMNASIEMARKTPEWTADVPEGDRKRALDRAGKERGLFEGAEILWVDDHPANNRNEARMLRSFGALITFACTTDEALRALSLGSEQNQSFHVILSDINREFPKPCERAGLDMLKVLRDEKHFEPVVFYIGKPKPDAGTPAGAFGLTNRPDQLLHLTLDALARTRGTR